MHGSRSKGSDWNCGSCWLILVCPVVLILALVPMLRMHGLWSFQICRDWSCAARVLVGRLERSHRRHAKWERRWEIGEAELSSWLQESIVRKDTIDVEMGKSPAYSKAHFTHQPRAVTMKLWEPKRSVQRPSQVTSTIRSCWFGPSSVVWSHMWLGLQPNAILMNFYSCEVLAHDRTNQQLWDFIVPWSPNFVLGLLSRGDFWNNPSGHETWSHLMPCRNSCRLYIHLAFYLLCLSLKQTWTSSIFFVTKSASSAMVTSPQPHV